MIKYRDNIVPKDVLNKIFSDEINPEHKDMDYHRQVAEYVFANYYYSDGAFGYSNSNEIEMMRLYSWGDQPIEQYKTQLIGKKDQEGKDPTATAKRKSWASIKWEVFTVAPKFVRVLKNRFSQIEYDCEIQSVDEKSVNEKEQHKYLMMSRSYLQPWLDGLQEKYNVQLAKPQEWLPDNIEQLNLYHEIGAGNLLHEIVYKKIIDLSMDVSKWDEQVSVRCQEDLIDYNVAITKDYIDPKDHMVKTRYVDIQNFVGFYDRRTGFDDSWAMGEVRMVTIFDIRQSLIDEGVEKSVIDVRMEELAQRFAGQYSNSHVNGDWNTFKQYDSSKRQWNFDNFSVPVLDLEFKSIDKSYIITDKKKDATYRGEYGKIINNERKTTSVNSVHVIRKVCYPVGSEWVYSYGLANDIKRDNMKDVTMSYNTVFIPGTSLTKQAIPVYDKIAINYLKHQNAIAKAPPSGIAININAIKSVSFGSNQTLEAPEIIKVYTQSGFLIYSQSAHAGMGNISQGSPIQQLPGGIGAQLDEFFRNFEMALAELREIFGVTPQASAAGKPINEGLGLAKMQMGVTDNSLSVMYDQARALKEKTATGIYRRFNVFVKNNPEWFNNAYPMLGQANTITIKLSSDMFDRNCHVKVVCLPNDEQKSIAIDAARESLKAGRNGGVGIKYADFVFVLRLIERGRVKEANAYISYKEEYYEKVAAKNQTALEEAKAKMVAEENARKEEAAKKMLELESSIEIDKTQKIEDIKFGFEKKRWEEIEKPRIQLESQLENAKVQKKP